MVVSAGSVAKEDISVVMRFIREGENNEKNQFSSVEELVFYSKRIKRSFRFNQLQISSATTITCLIDDEVFFFYFSFEVLRCVLMLRRERGSGSVGGGK